MNELGMSKWLIYYKYRDMDGHMIEESEVISLWINEVELKDILKKLTPKTNATRNIVIMNMVRLK